MTKSTKFCEGNSFPAFRAPVFSTDYEWIEVCNPQSGARGKLRPLAWIDKRKAPMALRVERLVAGDIVVLRVSGRIEHVDTLRELLNQEESTVAIDLREVTLINREAVRFLALSEANGVELRNCADYIREWITRERRRE